MLDSISAYIYTVYKQKSVSRAANELFISQPALSSAIKREEKRLGFEIFNRNTAAAIIKHIDNTSVFLSISS